MIGGKLLNISLVTCLAYVLVQQVFNIEVINKPLTKSRYLYHYFWWNFQASSADKVSSVSLRLEADKNMSTQIQGKCFFFAKRALCRNFNVKLKIFKITLKFEFQGYAKTSRKWEHGADSHTEWRFFFVCDTHDTCSRDYLGWPSENVYLALFGID